MYVNEGILSVNPFETLDFQGVGHANRYAIENGRKTNTELEIGVCGEHGGDPESIRFLFESGVDYVSCSPFRVPIARLAAAQAVLSSSDYLLSYSNLAVHTAKFRLWELWMTIFAESVKNPT